MRVRVTLMTENNKAIPYTENPEEKIKDAWNFVLKMLCAKTGENAYVEKIEVFE